jgi:E3 ubiquitin-protein ligase DOA10
MPVSGALHTATVITSTSPPLLLLLLLLLVPFQQVLRSTGCWMLSAASLVAQGAKLLLLLLLELGAFPLAAGLWLDFCALPLTASSLEQRSELLARSPMITGFMHWVLGVGFLLGLTFLVCIVREVLRPGALPFLRDPANPERNPVREMMERPLLEHLGRVALAWLAYAGGWRLNLAMVETGFRC